MALGPNVRKLVALKMAIEAVPPGGSLESVLEFLTRDGALPAAYVRARKFAELAIATVRGACGPNPWSGRSDEEIAGMLIEKIAERDPRLRGRREWGA